MNLLSSNFFRRCGATSGASALCLSLCLGLWSASSSFAADSLTDADEAKITTAIIAALQTAPISFNNGAVNTVPWLFPSFEGQTLGEWLMYTFGSSSGTGDNFYDMLSGLLQTLNADTSSIDSRLSSGLLTGAQREQLLTWLSDIQLWGEAPATANGFRTTDEFGQQAWSVRDADANTYLYGIDSHVSEILSLLQHGGQPNWDGLQDVISGSLQDVVDSAKGSADISDQQKAAASALSGLDSDVEDGKANEEYADEHARFELDSLINSEHSMLPFLDNIPDLNEIEDAPTRTISRPDFIPYVEDWVLVEAGYRLVDEEKPGSIALPEIALKRSATVTETSRPFFEWAGRITSALWALGFGVWILHVARSDWAFYTSGGGSDATMLAEQMEARRCLDINAALFSDSSLL